MMNRINWTELKPQIQQVGRLSLPAILTQITTIAMQYIDSAMVGALGANASAAIGLVSSTTWLLSGTIYAVSAGFSVQVAHQIGGNHDKKARDVVRHGIASALVVSAVLCLIGLLISHPLPGWLGGAQKIRQNATLYFMMFAIMLPFSQLNSLMSSFLQCSGDMVTPSILNAVMCVLDVIFNALLIPVFGVMGAGMGTMLACAVISLTGAWFCCVRNPQLRLRRKEKTVFDAKILKTAFKIGVPVAVQEIAMNSAMVAATMLIAPLGSIAIAANSFAVTAEGLCYMPGYGIGSAATTLVGRSYGAGNYKLAKRYGNICIAMGAVLMAITGGLMMIFCPFVFSILTPDPQVPLACRRGTPHRTARRAVFRRFHRCRRSPPRNRRYVCAKPSEPWQHLGHPPRPRGTSHHSARPARHVDRHGYRALHPRIAAALPPAYIEIL